VKLTKREKIMLTILGLLIIIGGYYKFILSSQLEKVNQLEEEVAKKRAEVERIKIEISPNSHVHKDFKIINAKVKESTKHLFPVINQEKIIVILDDLLEKANLQVPSISFSEIDINEVDVKKPQEKDKDFLIKNLVEEYKSNIKEKKLKANNEENEDLQEDKEENQIEKMTVTINYKGKYKNIIDFITKLEEYDKKIIVNNISISAKSGENNDEELVIDEKNEVKGSISLDFYSLPKIHEQDEEYFKWDFDNGYGKDDPFVPYAGYTEYSNNKKIINNDFIMTVKPISSDLPTVIIGRAMDKMGKSYVYADNSGFENVEFQLIQVDKKYYYKYKTQGESYPKDYENDMIEFYPRGTNVNLNIISNKRNGEKDNSGINLSLVNKTNLKLNVKIDYEDNENPRVKIVNKLGNVKVIK
jgi:type IV pilus assembly protein PilO